MARLLIPVLFIAAIAAVVWLVVLIRNETAQIKEDRKAKQETRKERKNHRAQILMKREELIDWYNEFIIKTDASGGYIPRELIEARNKVENPPTPAHLEAALHDLEVEKARLDESK